MTNEADAGITLDEARRAWVEALTNAGDDAVVIRETRTMLLDAAKLLEQTAEGEALIGVVTMFDAAMKKASIPATTPGKRQNTG